jgi:glycosyltransferase involved in cell wall biosynthesis
MDFTFACDIMMDLEGSIRPAMYLATELNEKGYKVSMMSPMMTRDVEERLKAKGMNPINLHARLAAKGSGLSVLWFETWGREAFLSLNSRHVPSDSATTINFSQVISVPAAVWYLQGPPSFALKDIKGELSSGFKIAYNFLKPAIEYADSRLINKIGRISSLVIANSKFCASMYSQFGIKVHDIIYPPIDCRKFQPSTSSPSADYVLTYFGKETKFSIIKDVADSGVKVKAFGSKTPYVEKNLTRHPNVEVMGRVTTDQLLELYSNALFTLFPFTHEPFGYIPLESMACGTPVLTYGFQGPSECVVDKVTGWLARSDDEITKETVRLWNIGIPLAYRYNCVKEALKFDKSVYTKSWLEILEATSKDHAMLYPVADILKSSSYLTQ